MAQQLSGKRYAQAIFDLAIENNQVEQWGEDLMLVAEAFQDAEFAALLKRADMPAADKLTATASVLATINPLVRNLVDLLVSKNSVDSISGVYSGYTELLDRHLGRQRVEITTAVSLESAETDRISAFVGGLIRSEVVLTTKVDESILGGLVIQIGDRLLDGSTKARLDGLRNRLHTGVGVSSA
jgi:F-type H+-transporting ATPase subunit delta